MDHDVKLFILFPKQCAHTEGVLTVRVKLGPVFNGGVHRGVLFLSNSTQNGFYEMSMCVSIAQARTKRAPRDLGPAFFL